MKLDALELLTGLEYKQTLRYGENPHQQATWYAFPDQGLSNATQLQGKELSYNNLIDLEAAISTIQEFKDEESPAAVVIKHTNPCGVALGRCEHKTSLVPDTQSNALKRALDADRTSCFGGIIALNREADVECAEEICKSFYECIVAPKFSADAQKILSTKPNLRLLEMDVNNVKVSPHTVRSILGGVLVQEKDDAPVDISEWKVVTERQPTEEEMRDMIFTWKVCRHVRSNAIVLGRWEQTWAVGAGQMNRVGSAKITFNNSVGGHGQNHIPYTRKAVMASDGFFPFSDTVTMASNQGIEAIIQPGGSLKDQDSIDACNENGMTMIFTGKRHFLH